ncbi:asparagine synthetase B [Natronococcus pandeyae]|uniref:Putative asparagine synthetase [glutamine-hydrolyzing] n=1 Tax=Natronococcus pandeyae TaxID=2055836 RepID=A0A8J8PXT6_9EURY|nr:asparagine synthase-related protein [Natronococcus pandeyae]TYL36440.1 asparagine synthetase B [Natronococcus pandeyae]
MSAITGIYRRSEEQLDTNGLTRMARTLSHRGPDGVGIWSGGSVEFGHRMLYTTPESRHATYPLQRGKYVLTADVRLDNRAELIAELDLERRRNRPTTDGELLLAAYERWGDRCPNRLLGAFVFAIWDDEQNRVFCARDHVGIRPLYYHLSDNLFVFGSEIRALRASPDVPTPLNEVRIGEHLAGLFEDKTGTAYRSISRLPPAHTMTVTPEDVTSRNYWTPDPSRELQLDSDQAYAERFKELFEKAVRCRLRSTRPVGATLSGGLDSSSITTTAADLTPDQYELPTFSAVFDAVPESNERRFIEDVIDETTVAPTFVSPNKTSPLPDTDGFASRDGPIAIPTLYVHRELCRAASQRNVRVLLHGFGGDSTVSYGFTALPEYTHTGYWRRLLHETECVADRFDVPVRTVLWGTVLKPMIPSLVRDVWGRVQGWDSLIERINSTIDPEFADRIGLQERIQRFEIDRPPVKDFVRGHHYRNLTSGFVPFSLESSDRTAARFGLEVRYPFLDKRLIEYCLALPPEQFLRNGWSRSILRRAMGTRLPDTVAARVWKTDLSEAFSSALITHERDRLEKLSNSPAHVDAYIDRPALQQAIDRLLTDQTLDDARPVWRALTLEDWLRGLSFS